MSAAGNNDVLRYKGYALSDFQQESIKAILGDQNVILATHTGNGKTLVADYAVNDCFHKGLRVVYTAPIKALSNQKFNQFRKEYGDQHVGLITGDRTINQDAPIIVVTTEVLRNMMHEDPARVRDIKFIILDEIHYINNEERGTVWEEVIIFKGPEARIIGLSATIPNVADICDWISTIHQEPVKQVFHPERIVKQKHFYYDRKIGRSQLEDLQRNYHSLMETNGFVPYRTNHLDFIKFAVKEQILPVLYFSFSRRQCEEKAVELAQTHDLLTEEERDTLCGLFMDQENLYPDLTRARSWATLKMTALKGVGYHHAGLLPVMKQFMESLFEQKLVKVLYATETFAVGINFPVKTVCFDSLRKFDGKGFRNLLGSEYLQMAGRAGRRGIDKFGWVYVLADYRALENGELPDLREQHSEAITSQFGLTYNTVLNLRRRFSMDELAAYFQKSFANYQYLKTISRYQDEFAAAQAQAPQSALTLPAERTCKQSDPDICPLIHLRNREKLHMLEVALRRKGLSDEERGSLNAEIATMRERVANGPFKCAKDQRKVCERAFKANKQASKELGRKERVIHREMANRPEVRFGREFNQRTAVLEKLGYISADGELLPRGQICAKLHVQEVLVTELLFEGFFHSLDEDTINAICAGIVMEDVGFVCQQYEFHHNLAPLFAIIEHVQKVEIAQGLEIDTRFCREACGVMHYWSSGGDFFEISENTTLSEGDFVSLCRRTSDLLRQIRNTELDDPLLDRKIKNCIAKIDRGMVTLGL